MIFYDTSHHKVIWKVVSAWGHALVTMVLSRQYMTLALPGIILYWLDNEKTWDCLLLAVATATVIRKPGKGTTYYLYLLVLPCWVSSKDLLHSLPSPLYPFFRLLHVTCRKTTVIVAAQCYFSSPLLSFSPAFLFIIFITLLPSLTYTHTKWITESHLSWQNAWNELFWQSRGERKKGGARRKLM